jgi:hypothetical protein
MKNHVKTRCHIRGNFMFLIILADPGTRGVLAGRVPMPLL